MDLTGNKISVLPVANFPKHKPQGKKSRKKRKNSVGDLVISQLVPLRGAMVKQLRQRGYDTSKMPFRNIIPLYYNEFVSTLEDSYDNLNAFSFRNNPSFRIALSDNLNGTLQDVHKDYIAEISTVIDDIINVFSDSHKKRQAALSQGFNPRQVLTRDELTQAQAVIKAKNSLEAKEINSKPVSVGEMKNILFFGFIFLLIWYVIK
jgi:hypothetical protein